MNFTFDGVNKIIIPTDAPIMGQVNVDVRDLYSRWVDWLLIGDNSKYQQAMRVVGGDPLPGSKELGLTYFLMNDWKIRPYEAQHVFNLNGNLYSEDGTSPYTSTIGAYNITIINSVSNLVDSTVQQLPEIEYASFNGGVTIDLINGSNGTLYPIGTQLSPVNNLIDANIIATTRGLKKLFFIGNFTFTNTTYLTNYDLIGQGTQSSTFTFQDGSIVAYCKAFNAKLTGQVLGITGFEDCHLFNYSSSGVIPSSNTIVAKNCMLEGILSLPSNFTGKIISLDCWGVPTIVGEPPILNMGNATFDVQIRNFSGVLQLENCSQVVNDVRIFMNSGRVKLLPTVTAGNIVISGVTLVEDLSNGAQVNILGAISTTSVIDSIQETVGSEIEYASFNNRVTLNVITGVSGTSYPIGTPTSPVNNLIDAKIIANYRGFKHIELLSDLTILSGENIDELHFISTNWRTMTIEPGVSTRNTNFDKISLYGEFDGFWNVLFDCWVYNITNFCGWLRGGSFINVELAPFNIESSGQSYFDDIVPMYPDVYSNIICNTETNVAISSFTGKLAIKSMTADCNIEVGFRTGKLFLDNSNTGGLIKVRGVCELQDESVGTAVDDDTLNVMTITDGVWNEQITDHQIIGSTGKSLGTASSGGVDYELLAQAVWDEVLTGHVINDTAAFIMKQIANLATELHKIQGLDSENPMTITPTIRTAGDIALNIEGDGQTLSIITRQ